jgi:hypothetical protein
LRTQKSKIVVAAGPKSRLNQSFVKNVGIRNNLNYCRYLYNIMKIFNSRAASEEYMSTHTLTFSTPEMTLKKFALWLSEQVTIPGQSEQVPRLMLFIKEFDNEKSDKAEFMPDIDESFRPSGAVADMYSPKPAKNQYNSEAVKARATKISCNQCGQVMKEWSKFCPKCGTKQVT